MGEKVATVAAVTAGAAALVYGLPVLIGLASRTAGTLFATRGLSSNAVQDAAAGLTNSGARVIQAGSKPVLNTVSAATQTSLMGKTFKTAAGLTVLGGYLFTTNLALNERGDALQSLSMEINNAVKAGDTAKLQQLKALFDDINSDGNALRALVPILNYPMAALDKARALGLTVDSALNREQAKDEIDQKKAEEERASIDYFNEQRLRTEQLIIQAQNEDRNDDASFWINYRKQILALEEEERQKIALFWEDYRKRQAAEELKAAKERQKQYDESRPSRLGFGLFR